MIAPFEYFRTPILIYRFNDGFYNNGFYKEGSQLTLSTDLITGNVIHLTLNGVALTPVTFTTSHLVTMQLLVAEILAQPNIQYCDLTNNNLTVTIVPLPPAFAVTNAFTVTGGASQPTTGIIVSPIIINATASVQPIGKDIVLVPEGRRDRDVFKMYTSTEIFGITTQNPDQIQVLKSPFTGLIFEVTQINEWENNSNFNVTNHYKYICMRLHPLP